MTILRDTATLGRAVWLSTAAASACLLPLTATAQSRAGLSVSTGATAASNPYLLNAPDTEAIGANLTIDPFVYFEEEDTTVTLDGSFTLEKFSKNVGIDESVSLGASGVHHRDERTIYRANAGFRSSRSAARRYFSGLDLENLEPGDFPDNAIVDPTLGYIEGRTSRLDVDASVERLVGPNGILTASTGLGLTKVDSVSGVDYRDASLSLSYSKRTTPRTSLRTTVDAGYVDYLNQPSGDGFFTTALLGLDHQWTQSLSLSMQLGASLSDTASLAGGRHTTLSWAGDFDLCNTYPRGKLCATASRSAQPTSLGGLTNVSSIGLGYSHSFGAVATGSINATYARTGRGQQAGFDFANSTSELVSLSASYRRQLGERLSAFILPSFTSIDEDLIEQRANYQVMLGISYRFGRLR